MSRHTLVPYDTHLPQIGVTPLHSTAWEESSFREMPSQLSQTDLGKAWGGSSSSTSLCSLRVSLLSCHSMKPGVSSQALFLLPIILFTKGVVGAQHRDHDSLSPLSSLGTPVPSCLVGKQLWPVILFSLFLVSFWTRKEPRENVTAGLVWFFPVHTQQTRCALSSFCHLSTLAQRTATT